MSSDEEPAESNSRASSSSEPSSSEADDSSSESSNDFSVEKPNSKEPSRPKAENPHWALKPPEGSVLAEHGQSDTGEFDWNSIQEDEDVELVLFRLPHGLKPKHLSGMQLTVGGSHGISGSTTHKSNKYDVRSLLDAPTDGIGGDDLKGLKLLLPRRKDGGKLFLASKPISECYLISNAHSDSTQAEPTVLPYTRPRYPPEMLSHLYTPFGSNEKVIKQIRAQQVVSDVAMAEISTPDMTTPKTKKRKDRADDSSPSKKKKKRVKEDA